MELGRTVGAASLRAELEAIALDAERAWRSAVEGAEAERLLGWVVRAVEPLLPRLRSEGTVQVASAAYAFLAFGRTLERLIREPGIREMAGVHLRSIRERLVPAFPADLPPAQPLPPSLVLAYLGSEYCVEPPGGGRCCFRVGAETAELDLLLSAHAPQTRAWTLITAWNPRSFLMPARENAQAQGRLARRLVELGLESWPGWGAGEGWREDSLFVHGLGREEARWLGREFEQVAVVCGQPGGTVELVFCGPRTA